MDSSRPVSLRFGPDPIRRPHRPYRRALFGLLLAGLAIVAPARADDPPPGSPVPSDPVFTAVRTDGTTASGRIRRLGPAEGVVLVDGATETASPGHLLVKLSRDGDPPASPPEGSLVVFPDGDRLRAGITTSNETSVEVIPNILNDAAIRVPLDRLLGLILAPLSEPDAAESLLARVRTEPRTSEVLWMANGERIPGGFLGLSPQKVSLQREGVAPEVERSLVVAIEFDPNLATYPKPEGTYLELTFLDGSRLGVTECRLEQGHLVAMTRFGVSIRPALSDLSRVHVRSKSIVYLSEQKERLAEYVGYIGTHRKTYGRDVTFAGKGIRLGGQPYDRGLGTQSRTLLVYPLGPEDRRFQSTIGLDDRAGSLGSVGFRVLLDGKKEVFSSGPMTVRDAPRAVDVVVEGARFLVLVTEFEERGDVQDLADWAEARLIRDPARKASP